MAEGSILMNILPFVMLGLFSVIMIVFILGFFRKR